MSTARIAFLSILCLLPAARAGDSDLPVNVEALSKFPERKTYGILNLLSLDDLQGAFRSGDGKGLVFDLSHVERLLDGRDLEHERVYGVLYAGPYPFEAREARFAYRRFRMHAPVGGGKALLDVDYLFRRRNSEGWGDAGNLAIRAELYLETKERDRPLGRYDVVVRVARGGKRLPTIVEGPLVNLATSEDPSRVVISFRTDRPVRAAVIVGAGEVFTDAEPAVRHEIEISGLEPDTGYRYWVTLDPVADDRSNLLGLMEDAVATHLLRTAPKAGAGTVRVAFCGDSREGHGGGERALMGVNHTTIERLASIAYREGADLMLMGGDLVNGYTTAPDDFRLQLHAWKQSMAGFWNERPVYPAMGNHEALLHNFNDGSKYGISVDRWPYETESAEAVFQQEFVNPRNGPETADPRRPTYRENVYSFRYGPVKAICFNNNYWINYAAQRAGGCPEGYLMEDQLSWIQEEISSGDGDPTVRYILLYAQEPVFPNGGHLRDAMWHNGSNRVRAHTYHRDPDRLEASSRGMLDVRNALVRMVARSPKVAAVLGSDEHSYHKVLIDRHVPVGDPERDDADGDGRLEGVSPLPDLAHAVWYLVCGGGGAPYYVQQPTPWNRYWESKGLAGGDVPAPSARFYYSSQENVFLFEAGPERISLRVLNPRAEIIDRIDDLMAVKRGNQE